MLLLLQSFKSGLRILQAEGNIIQRRPHLLLLHKLHHLPEHATRSKINAPEDTELPQCAHHVWGLLSAARATDHTGDCDQALKPDGAQRLGHRRGADHVDHMVNSAPLGREASGQLAPVRMLLVIYNVPSAEGEQPVCLCVGARYCDNVGASCYCNLESVSTLRSSKP